MQCVSTSVYISTNMDLTEYRNTYPALAEIYAQSMRENFNLPCLTDFTSGESLTYGDFARRMARLHLLFDLVGIQPGDKVALLGKNTITWVTVFMATLTYGAVIVPILAEFNPKDAQHIINHSDAKLLFVSDAIWEDLNSEAMPGLVAALSLDTRHALLETPDCPISKLLRNLTRKFRNRYKQGFNPENIQYRVFPEENTALINYTSGTTGFSKGVMLPIRSLWGNVVFGMQSKLHYRGSRALSFLPLAHAYGCAFDMLVPLAVGTHITVLGRTPNPSVLLKALAQVKPSLIICVPLILEKIYRRMIVPSLQKTAVRWALAVPLLDRAIYPKIRHKLVEAFGGEFEEVIVGGAPLNAEVEDFLHKIKFPFTVGYGMTECGPLISYTPWRQFIPTSSGRTLPGLMEAKIVAQEVGQPGEICVRGINAMSGYYKKPDITADVLDEDGWLHTGDMGVLGGPDGQTIFIRGRYKTMILSATGQNIYPEEIEGKLNNMPCVAESLIVERNGHLEALVYPDSEYMDKNNIDDSQLGTLMEENRKALNNLVAPYEKIERIELRDSEFEKTPKRSIKRFLYK